MPLHSFTVGEPWDQVWHKMKRTGWRDVAKPRIIGTDDEGLIVERFIKNTCTLRLVLARSGPGIGMYKITTIEQVGIV